MIAGWKRPASVASALLVLLALGACGDRVENTGMPQPEHPSVEINRQGMAGSDKQDMAQGVVNDTSSAGAEPEHAHGLLDRKLRG